MRQSIARVTCRQRENDGSTEGFCEPIQADGLSAWAYNSKALGRHTITERARSSGAARSARPSTRIAAAASASVNPLKSSFHVASSRS